MSKDKKVKKTMEERERTRILKTLGIIIFLLLGLGVGYINFPKALAEAFFTDNGPGTSYVSITSTGCIVYPDDQVLMGQNTTCENLDPKTSFSELSRPQK